MARNYDHLRALSLTPLTAIPLVHHNALECEAHGLEFRVEHRPFAMAELRRGRAHNGGMATVKAWRRTASGVVARATALVAIWGLASTVAAAPARPPAPPDAVYGPLFLEVQRTRVFDDQKTFVDCVPRTAPAAILHDYAAFRARHDPSAPPERESLRQFVAAHFLVPEPHPVSIAPTPDVAAHIEALWPVLTRPADQAAPGSSLLPLHHPYVVPGGRFREVYYWDSYFTLLGLAASNRFDLIGSMVANFADLIDRFGHVPNGNRTYYLSRSQPPFFSLMVDLLAAHDGDAVYRQYLPALEAEYRYWMDRSAPTHHVVELPGGGIANRYWDQRAKPRDESFAEDEHTAAASGRDPAEVYRELRSAAESGWDFSTRWFGDGKTLATIRTTRLAPVDLNALLCHLEATLAHAYELSGDTAPAQAMHHAADARKRMLQSRFWSARLGCFTDYDLDANAPAARPTLAMVVPLFLGLATPQQAASTATVLRRDFLRPGGLVTTLVHSGQQWDAPNGWAPLQWMAIQGLDRYGEHELAREIARRWIAENKAVYHRTGKLVEKYNVEDPTAAGGGGEYPTQDGFGWTNGVLLALLKPDREHGHGAR